MGKELFSPDSLIGKIDREMIKNEKMEKYFRKPPNKRINYKKLSIASPFSCPFTQLIKESSKSLKSHQFYVLRNATMLREMKLAILKFDYDKVDDNALLPIRMYIDRGSVNDFSIICLPHKRDIKRSLEMKYTKSHDVAIHVESPAKDDEESARKALRFNHKKMLKRLRNRRVRAKRKLQATSEGFVRIEKASNEKLIKNYLKKMSELWLPKVSSIRSQCSREVCGYVTQSSFCFTEGKFCSIGYVTREGMKNLMHVFSKFRDLKPFFLVRSTNSLKYLSASFHININ
jgi:ribonuclease P/MRP protein subunit POP1